MFGALTRLATGRPRRVVLVGVLLAIAAGATGGSVANRLEPYAPTPPPGTESRQAATWISAATGTDPDSGLIALFGLPGRPGSTAARAKVARVGRILAADPDVARVVPRRPRAVAVSRDGRLAYLVAAYTPHVSPRKQQDAARRLSGRLGPTGVELGGSGAVWAQGNDVTVEDFRRAELISFPLLLLLSLWFFRSAAAALVAAAFGGLAIAGSLLVLRLVAEVTFVSIFALNVAVSLGVGLAFDYCLLVISRFREETAAGSAARAAIGTTLRTSGRAIALSAATVVAALSSMLVFPDRSLSSMGIAGAAVTVVSCLLALCVLPAALYLVGPRIDALSPAWLRRAGERDARPVAAGGWYRLTALVTRRPAIFALAATAGLVLLAVPALRLNLTQGSPDILPRDQSAHVVNDTLRRRFDPPQASTPVRIAIRARDTRAVSAFAKRVGRLRAVAAVSPPRRLDARTVEVDAVSRADPLAKRSQSLVRAIRREPAPFAFAVGGQSAVLIDGKQSLRDHLPAALAVAVVTMLGVLFLLTGSAVLPLKAVVMNLLSIGATLGAMVLVFQDGRFEQLLGYHGQGGLILTIPPLIAALGFGLATDYGIFVLARIKEEVDRGAADRAAVAAGTERTGRVVTGAALLFGVAVGATATGQMVTAKEAGLGLVAAVTIDAFVVRSFLVPSLMAMLGRANWWAPPPLRRLAARIGVRAPERPQSTSTTPGDAGVA